MIEEWHRSIFLDDHRSWNVNGEDKQPFPRKGKNTQQVDLSHLQSVQQKLQSKFSYI
jgi:hypothetical protein